MKISTIVSAVFSAVYKALRAMLVLDTEKEERKAYEAYLARAQSLEELEFRQRQWQR